MIKSVVFCFMGRTAPFIWMMNDEWMAWAWLQNSKE
jgi:hypothetical protein